MKKHRVHPEGCPLSSPKESDTQFLANPAEMPGFNSQNQSSPTIGLRKFLPSLQAKLTCEFDGTHWTSLLSAFKINQPCSLIDTSQTDLPSVLPIEVFIDDDKREMHQKAVDSVLSEGPTSASWRRLINGMLENRYIRMRSYPPESSKKTRRIGIVIELQEQKSSTYVFNVAFYDNTPTYRAAVKAGNMSHNLRGAFSGITSEARIAHQQLTQIKLNRETLEPTHLLHMFEELSEHITNIEKLANGGLEACAPTFASFLPENNDADSEKITTNDRIEDINAILDTYIHEYLMLAIEELRTSKVHLFYKTQNQLWLEFSKIEPLKDLLYNLIKNAVNAHATEISIETQNQDEVFQCDIMDNGPGLPLNMRHNFFNRSLNQHAKNTEELTNITANRGEGSLVSYLTWVEQGGTAEDKVRPDGYSGTLFSLKIPGRKSVQLDQAHIHFMENIPKTTQGILLLVDDTLMQIKLLVNAITQDSKQRNEAFKQVQWGSKSLILMLSQNWVIACAAHPEMAFQFASAYSPTAVITDQELDTAITGADLIVQINEKLKSEHIQFAIHSSHPQEYFVDSEHAHASYPKLNELDVTFLLKGGGREALDLFLEDIGYKSSPSSLQSYIKH